ncbi:unnamed protein product [Caenorhabditis sp. 36 PRJEB53466]|nr:unnamed protein product [Caenorhabditis sp. 36 PRJEB53466]
MYSLCRSRGRSSRDLDDTFHQVYLPLLKMTLNFSIIKYIVLVVYCIRSMQEHLAIPTYCNDPKARISCSSSTCYWLHKIVMNLPKFMINASLFVEQCAYLLVFFFISCSLFLYAVFLMKRESDLRMRYRAILTLPSLFFELGLCFFSYYSVITSIFEYSRTASTNPDFFSSAFVIFAFIISIFYALLLVAHVVTLYYIMIFPITPLTIYAVSNANYSAMKYSHRSARSLNYDYLQTIPSVPTINETYGVPVNNWQAASDTRGTVSSYSQIRSWNNTVRSTNTLRTREIARNDENDYLELI